MRIYRGGGGSVGRERGKMALTKKQRECLQRGLTHTVVPAFTRGGLRFRGDFHRKTITSLVSKGLMAQRPDTPSEAFWTTEEGRLALLETLWQ